MLAVVLAAGEGTRLRPLTEHQPKPMVPLGGRPALEYVFAWLVEAGIDEICINLHYKPDSIVAHFGDGSRFGFRAIYNREDPILGTAGGVREFRKHLTSTFVVCYGDVLSDLDIPALLDFHRAKGGVATVALYRVEDPWNRGVVDLDGDQRILGFREKPPREECTDNLVNSGVYVLEPGIFDFIARDGFADFGHDVFPAVLNAGVPMYGWPAEAYVIDYGSFTQYDQANIDIVSGKLKNPLLRPS